MPKDHAQPQQPQQEVALFATCLVNSYRPEIGFAAAHLLEMAGCRVSVPYLQSCCGQPNYNNGDPKQAKQVAKNLVREFEAYDYVVVPSASCAGMIKNHYPTLFADEPQWLTRIEVLAAKTWELVTFLVENAPNTLPVNTQLTGKATLHDSCSSLREIPAGQQARLLLERCFPNLTIVPLTEPEACCGFGGTFCVKFNAISRQMGNNKLQDIESTHAQYALSLDLGCLLHLESLQGNNIKLRHVLQFVADNLQSDRSGVA